jgi:hypothetical protein
MRKFLSVRIRISWDPDLRRCSRYLGSPVLAVLSMWGLVSGRNPVTSRSASPRPKKIGLCRVCFSHTAVLRFVFVPCVTHSLRSWAARRRGKSETRTILGMAHLIMCGSYERIYALYKDQRLAFLCVLYDLYGEKKLARIPAFHPCPCASAFIVRLSSRRSPWKIALIFFVPPRLHGKRYWVL